jgi:hypothetical protein
MPKRVKQEKRPTDVNQLAHFLGELSTKKTAETSPAVPSGLSAYMSKIGRKGGQIGGKRRLETMTSKERKRVAKKAANARWKNKSKHD